MINRRNFLATLGASAVVPALPGFASSPEDSAASPFDKKTMAADFEIQVAGDAHGGMIGAVVIDEGKTGIRNATVKISGTTPVGIWKQTVQSGENGIFAAAIPHGSTGTINIHVAKDNQAADATVNVRDLSLALTPRPPAGSENRLSLDGAWQFAVDPPANFSNGKETLVWHDIKVPAHWELEGFISESGLGVYKKAFAVPSSWAAKRIKLRAEAIYSSCEVFLNGERVGSHEGGATPFEIDITGIAKTGTENTIVVLVQARSKAHAVDLASFFAYFELAGIWQSIEVFAVEPAHISRLTYVTQFDRQYKDATLSVDVDVVNEQSIAASNIGLQLTLLDPDGKPVSVPSLTSRFSLKPWEKKKVTFSAKVAAPKPWNAEQPKLYTLAAQLQAHAGSSTKIETKAGFRTVEIRGKQFLLNGKQIKLLGVSRLESDPLLGRALTDELNKQDIALMKEANLNAFRATIFPPHSSVLDYADELGIYVEDEGPATWASVVWAAAVKKDTAEDLRYAPMYAGHMSEMLERDRNHPSVIYYSMCNESAFGRVLQIARDFVKKSDNSRPSGGTWATIDPDFPDRGGRADDFGVDVATIHHPITAERVRKMSDHPRPVLFDEVLTIFHGTEYLATELEIVPGMHDYWVEGVPEIIAEIRKAKNCLGAMQFSWTDDKFLVPNKGTSSTRRSQDPIRYTERPYKMPGRGILGEVAWGTLDGWRRPKPQFWLSKKIYSPIQIEEKPLPATSPVVVKVENLNTYINLDQYTCKWQIGDAKGSATANIEPGAKGNLSIPTTATPRPEDILVLEFYDWRNELVDAYKLAFREHAVPSWPNSGKPARILAENPMFMDEADPVRLVGTQSELSYDRSNGLMRWGLGGGEQVINLGPALHILRSDHPAELDYPSGWKFANETHAVEGNQAVVNWNGAYGTEFTGGFQIRMDDAGNAEFHYAFKYNGPDMYVREAGLRFELPLQFDTLTWERRAEYSHYPPDHIGRPIGEAVAHPKVAQTVPPGSRPFSLDDHAWGCNDFRSTKRNIYHASLKNQLGQGIKIISDGTQHVRTMVGVNDVHVNILDFYGGSGPLKSWSQIGFHYGPGKLVKTGDVVKGVVRIQLASTPKG
jgi:hypothetical protein